MATTGVNKYRKRKSDSNNIFEVDEEDCSPPSSPEVIAVNVRNNSCAPNDLDNDVSSQTDNSNLDNVEYVRTVRLDRPDSNKVLILSEERAVVVDLDNEAEAVICAPADVTTRAAKPALQEPLFTIKFRDKEFVELHQTRIVTTIMGLFDYNLKEEVDETNLEIKFWEEKSSCDMEIVEEDSNDNMYVVDSAPGQKVALPADIDELFVVDTMPSENASMTRQPRFCPDVKYSAIDNVCESAGGKGGRSACVRQSVCFNCDGQHALKDCRQPKDYRRIQAARNNFKNSTKTTRYHLDEEQKYGHLVPGKISEKLRSALNIGKHEIPSHVYHMRRVGYSPGWLQVARVTSSQMQLFDFAGCCQRSAAPRDSIDPGKVVEYPGFNVPLDKGCADDCKKYDCPPYSKTHSKAAMLAYFEQAQNAASEGRAAATPAGSPVVAGCDEDSSSNSLKTKLNGCKSRESSPTLTDLEMKKKQILEMLNNSIVTSSPHTPLSEEELNRSSTDHFTNVIKSSTFGTPILKNCSPYERLPCSENFSKDISQVINFENLPNSTGKYEQMSQVMTRVRKVIRFSGEETATS